jgi:hypothetical protein
MKVGTVPQEYFVIEYPNHEKNKQLVLDMVNSAEGQSQEDDWTKVSMTDLGINTNRLYFDRVIHEEFQALFENFHKWFSRENGVPDWQRVTYDFWYMQYEKGDYVKWHNHPLSTLSAVYFLDLKDNKDAVSFKTLDGSFHIPNVKEGDILIFPSLMVHSTMCVSEEGKTSINFNLKAGFDDAFAQEVKDSLEVRDRGDDYDVETI